MVKKPKRRSKHVPQRTCVGCREVLRKRALIRIVKGSDGVVIDLTGKAHGRGAYLHDKRSCWLHAINGSLNHALKTELTDQEKQTLIDYMTENLSDEDPSQRGAEGQTT